MIWFYYIYFICVAVPLLLTATILTALVTIIGTAIGNGTWWGYWPASVWARLFCLLSLVRVTVKGRDNIDKNTSYVFVANHQGAYDIFAIYGFLGHNFKWMMKRSLRRIFLVGYACDRAGHIFVDHSSPAAVRRTIETAEHRLRDGMSLVVFPEGARTLTGRMGPFKKGAYQLALEFKLPLAPVTIDGSFAVLPRTGILPRPGHIVLTIHEPMAAPATEEDRESVMDATRRAIASSLA